MNDLATKDVQQVTVRRVILADFANTSPLDQWRMNDWQQRAQKEVILRNAAERMMAQGLPMSKISSVLAQMRQEVALS